MATTGNVGGVIGANPDYTYPGATVGGVYVTGAGAPAQLGTKLVGSDGTRYILVQAASTSAAMASTRAPNAYAVLSTFRAKLMTSALAGQGSGLVFAPEAVIAAHDYFWGRAAGTGFRARVAASASAAKFLRTTATAGRLGTASTASCFSFAAVITAVASASTSVGNTMRTVYASELAPIAASSPI